MAQPRAAAYLASLAPGLPRSVWILEAGFFLNAYGTGIAYPFLIIYLHNVRGVELGTAGLVVAVMGGAGLVSGPLWGRTVDRVGPRITLAAALTIGAGGYALFPVVHEPPSAFGVACIVGIGSGGFWPSQSTLLAGLAPPARRHAAYAVQRGMFSLGLGLGGMTGGLIASTGDPGTFTILFLLDAAATLGFCALIPLIGTAPAGAEQPTTQRGHDGSSTAPASTHPVVRHGYRQVLRDRPFLGLIGLNVVFVTAGYTQLELLPVFAKNEAGVSERSIGVIFLVSSIALVTCQLPLAKLVEGRSRLRMLAVMPVLWALAWLIVEAGGAWLQAGAAATLFALAAAVFAVGECLDGPARVALIADLVPANLQGRYWALSANSWDLGYVIGPAVGGFVLAAAPLALWPLAAGVCTIAAVATLALERTIPRQLRVTPSQHTA